MTNLKQYKNSKGEDLPKEINEVVNAESQRLGEITESDLLDFAFMWDISNYFKSDNKSNWLKVDNGDYLQFYLEYKFKNAKGQIFPDEIQNEIYDEIKRQGLNLEPFEYPSTKFNWRKSDKGESYWFKTYHESDYQKEPTEPPIFIPNSGDMVEVSDGGVSWFEKKFYQYDSKLKYPYIVFIKDGSVNSWKHCRPIKTKVTIAELLECYATAKGLNVDNLEVCGI